MCCKNMNQSEYPAATRQSYKENIMTFHMSLQYMRTDHPLIVQKLTLNSKRPTARHDVSFVILL